MYHNVEKVRKPLVLGPPWHDLSHSVMDDLFVAYFSDVGKRGDHIDVQLVP